MSENRAVGFIKDAFAISILVLFIIVIAIYQTYIILRFKVQAIKIVRQFQQDNPHLKVHSWRRRTATELDEDDELGLLNFYQYVDVPVTRNGVTTIKRLWANDYLSRS